MEYRKKCNVCGHIWCYTDGDLKKNTMNSLTGVLGGLSTIASTFGGNAYWAFESDKLADRALRKVVDYDRCPHCGSTDVCDLKDGESTGQSGTAFVRPSISVNENASRESLIKRIQIFMEDGDWIEAEAYCEHLLDDNPEDGDIYFLKFLIDHKAKSADDLINQKADLTKSQNYSKIEKYGTPEMKQLLKNIHATIEEKEKDDQYLKLVKEYHNIPNTNYINTSESYQKLLERFNNFKGYKEADKYIEACENNYKNSKYLKLVNEFRNLELNNSYQSSASYRMLIGRFESLNGYKDADEYVKACENGYKKLVKNEESKSRNVRNSIIAGVCILFAVYWIFCLYQ